MLKRMLIVMLWMAFLLTGVFTSVDSYKVAKNRNLSYNYVDMSNDDTPVVQEENGKKYVHVHGEKKELTSTSIYVVPEGYKIGYYDGKLVVPVEIELLGIEVYLFFIMSLVVFVITIVVMNKVMLFAIAVGIIEWVLSSMSMGYFYESKFYVVSHIIYGVLIITLICIRLLMRRKRRGA